MCAMLLLASFGGASHSIVLAQSTDATPGNTASPSPAPITLEQAIVLARTNEPGFAAAAAASRASNLDRSIARAALLPGVTYHNQFLYTQAATGPTGSANASASAPSVTSEPRFIANNAVHEYTSQGVVSETVGLQQITAVSRADATAAVASAELEIARRGLTATVVTLFYGSITADHKVAVAQRAAQEAADFTKLTQQRESAREAAHADVVKAELQQQQRDRDVADALLQQQKSHLELAILLFPDPRSPFTLAATADVPSLAPRADVEAAAAHSNPELRSALGSLRVRNLDVTAARAAYLPDLGLSFAYGIDADHFASREGNGVRNLGYSATATLDIPLWDWLSTQHKVQQAKIFRDAAQTALSATQRRLIAQLDESYAEAATSRDQLKSLDQSVDTARESLRLTNLRYAAGEATAFEVVDTQNSLTSMELAREDGVVRYETALANLQLLTGTF
jgi:outer membrane protein TolC